MSHLADDTNVGKEGAEGAGAAVGGLEAIRGAGHRDDPHMSEFIRLFDQEQLEQLEQLEQCGSGSGSSSSDGGGCGGVSSGGVGVKTVGEDEAVEGDEGAESLESLSGSPAGSHHSQSLSGSPAGLHHSQRGSPAVRWEEDVQPKIDQVGSCMHVGLCCIFCTICLISLSTLSHFLSVSICRYLSLSFSLSLSLSLLLRLFDNIVWMSSDLRNFVSCLMTVLALVLMLVVMLVVVVRRFFVRSSSLCAQCIPMSPHTRPCSPYTPTQVCSLLCT